MTQGAAPSAAAVEALAVLDAYLAAFNALNPAALDRTFHFPHFRLLGDRLTTEERAGIQTVATMRELLGAEWHRTDWIERRVVQSSADKVHVAATFTRSRSDGSVIGTFESLYVVTREQGRWGVKLRSSFAPR
jgi:hypothetical protein